MWQHPSLKPGTHHKAAHAKQDRRAKTDKASAHFSALPHFERSKSRESSLARAATPSHTSPLCNPQLAGAIQSSTDTQAKLCPCGGGTALRGTQPANCCSSHTCMLQSTARPASQPLPPLLISASTFARHQPLHHVARTWLLQPTLDLCSPVRTQHPTHSLLPSVSVSICRAASIFFCFPMPQ